MRKYDGKNSVECTAEEQAKHEEILAEDKAMNEVLQKEVDDKQALKDSAKAKLMSGEALTEEEANVMIGE